MVQFEKWRFLSRRGDALGKAMLSLLTAPHAATLQLTSPLDLVLPARFPLSVWQSNA